MLNSKAETASTVINDIQKLSLYHYDECPLCHLTRQTISNTKHDVELRNIRQSAEYRSELTKSGGSVKVPCLRIESSDKTSTWLYESSQIIQFLRNYDQQMTRGCSQLNDYHC